MYTINERFISQNRSYQPLSPIGIVLHETANYGGTDEMHYEYFNNAYRGASAHIFCDWDSITQLIPFSEKAWHSGYTANNSYYGVEMCRPKTYDEYKFNEVWKRTVWIFGYIYTNILGITQITKDNLMSHAEVSYKWKETDHVDPISYLKEYGLSVDNFRNAVQEYINTGIVKDYKENISKGSVNMYLEKGNISEEVKQLQYNLNKYFDINDIEIELVPDGDFGNRTFEAIKVFQQNNGLEVDGIVGNMTWETLNKAIEPKPVVEPEPVIKPTPSPTPEKSWWQQTGEDAIMELASKGFIMNPETWVTKDLENTPVHSALFFEMLRRILNSK